MNFQLPIIKKIKTQTLNIYVSDKSFKLFVSFEQYCNSERETEGFYRMGFVLLIYNKKWFSNDRERKCICVFMSESERERERQSKM